MKKNIDMCDDIHSIKTKLICELWLPISLEAGKLFYPRLRKNKRMKLFTLTDDANKNEINQFIKCGLSSNETIIAWNYSLRKKLRLETELTCRVEGGCKFGENNKSFSDLDNDFPFDLINLDFTSQELVSEDGRIEKEFGIFDKIVETQKQKIKNKNGFVIFYTTKLNSYGINKRTVSGNHQFNNNPEMTKFSDNILDNEEKKSFIEETLKRIFLKYGYTMYRADKKHYNLSNTNDLIFSIIIILEVRKDNDQS